mmetsp:Transcript_90988/g.257666  ORF Transcript_90988/g.257666 Transcript_90988/m.257666 type:complete len:178 (-) Transcript_90988:133-666(-)|eukprot:CAMPEP_0179260216 /NCGR_PEP_ID=MMETSP0797-20121207/26225_1 /TAXON_ID=47934 /ORGANISM="Dinophysis acuminata, Strain DAEP01" /LENGTH=177 /DNA_ID=CAMNT_0020968289 /DNA_START=66 /DNA_END=599 /DNA_ORIENTATION=-
MAFTPNGPVPPDWLVGPVAAALASTALMVFIIFSLALAIVQMRASDLSSMVRKHLHLPQGGVLPQSADDDDDEHGAVSKRRRWRKRPTGIQKIVEFFIGGDEEPEAAHDAFHLDDDYWLAPTLGSAAPPGERVHFMIGDSSKSDSSANAPHKTPSNDEFSLEDKIWRAPPESSCDGS